MKLNSIQREILRLCVEGNGLGRIGWTLRQWDNGAQQQCAPMESAGLVEFMRLGGYPGIKITAAGRAALAKMEAGE